LDVLEDSEYLDGGMILSGIIDDFVTLNLGHLCHFTRNV
jgi:hypothetical protein